MNVYSNLLDNNNNICRAIIKINDSKIEDVIILEESSSILCNDINLNLEDQILIPYFFNLHCHLGESLYEIEEEELPNLTVSRYINLTEGINKVLSQQQRNSLWYNSALFTIGELKKNLTCGICAARSAEICGENGLLNMSGFPIMDSEKLSDFIKSGLKGFEDYKNSMQSDTCSIGLFFHSLYSNGLKELALAQQIMRNGAEFFSIHLSEDATTRQKELAKYGMSPVEVLKQHSLLGSTTLIVHGGYLNEKDLGMIADAGSTIVVCPISNLTLHNRIPNLYKLNQFGIKWCVATDGYITGKTFSLIDQIKVLKYFFPEISNPEFLNSITTRPASFFKRRSYTGRLESGVDSRFIMMKKEDNLDKSISSLLEI